MTPTTPTVWKITPTRTCEGRVRPVRAFYPVIASCDRRGLYRIGQKAYCLRHAEAELGRKLTDAEKGR